MNISAGFWIGCGFNLLNKDKSWNRFLNVILFLCFWEKFSRESTERSKIKSKLLSDCTFQFLFGKIWSQFMPMVCNFYPQTLCIFPYPFPYPSCAFKKSTTKCFLFISISVSLLFHTSYKLKIHMWVNQKINVTKGREMLLCSLLSLSSAQESSWRAGGSQYIIVTWMRYAASPKVDRIQVKSKDTSF